MKTFVKFILQKILGLKTYLYVFAQFVIVKLRWDKKEKDFFYFMKLIPDGGLVLDLGANIGVTSYHLSKKLPLSTVFSFEPLELNMNTLRRLKKKHNLKNIQEYLVAVGEENGMLEMVMPVIDKVPMHGLSHVIHEENRENNEGLKYQVPVISLDGFEPIKTSEKKVTAMKIDVENFEYFVLKGGENLIKNDRPIIYCELWDNDNRKKCIELLNNLGYSALVLQKNKLVPFDQAIVEKHNFFFLTDEITY
jgi:FkbM family methyltransferase